MRKITVLEHITLDGVIQAGLASYGWFLNGNTPIAIEGSGVNLCW